MLTASLFTLASAMGAMAMPTAYPIYRRAMDGNSGVDDTTVLQYALTLEHLENKFYKDALAQFSEDDFAAAGYPSWVRGRYTQIAGHENDHVTLLAGALGDAATQPCEYSFPYTDVKSFISLATLIENVGVSAYAGAAQFISDPAYVTIAATILTTEARHQAWQSSAVSNAQPWSSAYDTALGLDMVYTIASAFITSCPESNPALPVKSFGALTVENGTPGQTATYTFDNSAQGDAVEYAIYYNGVGTAAVQLDANHMAMVPESLQGISYVLISTASSAADVTTDNIVAGPGFIVNNFDAWTENPSFMG